MKLKSKKETAPEATEEQTPVAPEEAVGDTPYMNADEQKALDDNNNSPEELKKRREKSYEKMSKTVALLFEKFNLADKDFVVEGFNDKGSKCILAMSNDDFAINVAVLNPEKFGLN